MPAVQVLLATYNGAAFLPEQLASLFNQTMQDFEILAADDGSTDGTLATLEAALTRHPGRIRIVYRNRVGGPAQNFLRLIDAADAPYLMFCDQDDVWLHDKIATMLGAIQSLEHASVDVPRLVHSDLIVVDDKLQTISPSYFRYQGVNPQQSKLTDLLLKNCVVGCATIFNRSLAELVRGSPPSKIVMHDWWIALTAAAFGTVTHIDQATTRYRQHRGNTLGARPESAASFGHFAVRFLAVIRGGALNRTLRRSIVQADAFLSIHGSALSADKRLDVDRVAVMARQGALRRRYTALRSGMLKEGLLRNIATLLVL